MSIINKTKSWVVLWMWWTVLSCLVWSAIPAQERAALIDLYHATSGDQWLNQTGWKTPPLFTDGFALPGTEATWYGVTISQDHVIYIILMENGLKGTLPATLGNLGQLQTLQLAKNQLSGSIPPELAMLSHLSGLGLSFNQLGGLIPLELGNLTQLVTLALTGNQLGGFIPISLSYLSHLQYLQLGSNRLMGSIPSPLGNLHQLLQLQLGNNQLGGVIPASFGQLTQLEYLWLNSNQLGGEIPTSLTQLSQLVNLDIGHNCLQATDASLRTWLNARDPDWEALQDQCHLTVTVPNGGEYWQVGDNPALTWKSVKAAASVKIEYTTDNGATWSTVIDSTPNVKYYRWIVPDTVSSQCKIKISEPATGNEDSSDNPFTIYAGIPLSERTALIAIYHSTNGDHWTAKNGWKTPPLHTDGFAKPGTEGTWTGLTVQNNHVTEIRLGQNNLTGTIPDLLGQLRHLEFLCLCHNHLGGIIPTGLVNLSRLVFLYLHENQLTGSIPSILGNLTSLNYLFLHGNRLSGSIPPELKGLENLVVLSLSINQLGGSIPPELGNLPKLQYLDLNNNQLTGEIPLQLTQLGQLISLAIDFNCLRATNPVVRSWLGIHASNWEEHQDTCPEVPTLRLNRSHLSFTAFLHSWVTFPQAVRIDNQGGGTLYWKKNDNASWLDAIPRSGIGNGTTFVEANPFGLEAGTYNGTIEVSDPYARNSPQTIAVTLRVKPLAEEMPPFGELATPMNGATVSSSVPVTGWALDDTMVRSVKIYREEGSSLVYIGDATLVEDARPDVEAAFPDYPFNYRAGWGYMLLTYFLPHGDGLYKIHAIATDIHFNNTDLGTTTITVDNAHAVKPFGAIDTPAQGGTVSGKYYVNYGWVLTPQPNIIPTDGSTIHLWIDGQDKGNPTYNNYRQDIATLFPGYRNSDYAIGYKYIDTTTYANGLHTIQWTATDSAGNTDGIGSRYFTIQNSAASDLNSMINGSAFISNEELAQLPPSDTPVAVKQGYPNEAVWEASYPDENHIIHFQIKELEPIQIQFTPQTTRNISVLPVGSTFDPGTGVFSWWPGPGFIGDYPFVFVEPDQTGQMYRKEILIHIVPKYDLLKINQD